MKSTRIQNLTKDKEQWFLSVLYRVCTLVWDISMYISTTILLHPFSSAVVSVLLSEWWAIFWRSSTLSQPLKSRSSAQSMRNGSSSLRNFWGWTGTWTSVLCGSVAQVRPIPPFVAVKAIVGLDPMRARKDFDRVYIPGMEGCKLLQKWRNLILRRRKRQHQRRSGSIRVLRLSKQSQYSKYPK